MPTYTTKPNSSSHSRLASCPVGGVIVLISCWIGINSGPVCAEQYAQPPEWTDEVNGVFFEDARKELKGEPPTTQRAAPPSRSSGNSPKGDEEVWRGLISGDALESAVKLAVSRVGQSVRQAPRFKAGGHNDCRRDLTLLGTLFEVIGSYPSDVRWQSLAPLASQLCLQSAESCAEGSDASFVEATNTLSTLEDVLRGQSINGELASQPLAPEFAPLMQSMQFVVDEELPAILGKSTQFRRSTNAVGEKAQLLAMLSQVIRGEEYGYADDETYQAHADRLRDAARELNDAATARDFEKAGQAAGTIQKACANCHGDYRG